MGSREREEEQNVRRRDHTSLVERIDIFERSLADQSRRDVHEGYRTLAAKLQEGERTRSAMCAAHDVRCASLMETVSKLREDFAERSADVMTLFEHLRVIDRTVSDLSDRLVRRAPAERSEDKRMVQVDALEEPINSFGISVASEWQDPLERAASDLPCLGVLEALKWHREKFQDERDRTKIYSGNPLLQRAKVS